MLATASSLSDAERIEAEFKEYAYIVSHDLGAPARAVVEFSRLLRDENPVGLSDDAKLYLSLITENGQKLQAMMAGLLEYSRLNTMAKNPSRVDCSAIMEQCLYVLKDKIKKTGATIEVGLLPKVNIDTDQAMQLFCYLLDNALTFYAPNTAPRVEIFAKQRDTDWLFQCQDHGIGIDAKFHTKIFKPFQRLHSDDEYPGIGMGLALAQKIVHRHSGTIWVESGVTQGASFIFSIPA